MQGPPDGQRGVAMVVALLSMLMMAALGAALILTTTAESRIARNFRGSAEGLYAADAILARAVDDLAALPDWNAVLSGSVQSAFVDGPPSGPRTLVDGRTIDLGVLVNEANCGQAGACSVADLTRVTADRPWGSNNPRWQPFAWGYLDDLAPARWAAPAFYVMVLAADDPSENDGDPLVDGGADRPGAGVISLRAEAFGRFGARRTVEATVSRPEATVYNEESRSARVRVLSWREVR